jgi:hypothetical protein
VAFVVLTETASSSRCTVSSRAFARGYSGGFLRRRTWIYALLNGGIAHQWRFLARSLGMAAAVWDEKP